VNEQSVVHVDGRKKSSQVSDTTLFRVYGVVVSGFRGNWRNVVIVIGFEFLVECHEKIRERE
jgi:hypothetical protein